MKGSGGVKRGWRLPDGMLGGSRAHVAVWLLPAHLPPVVWALPLAPCLRSGKQVAGGNQGPASLNLKSRALAQG